ncbi:MAG: hypothetical protein HYZ28_25840 [Myxococcales bacterium]|nr:hypothetical protein [Myxococcales bacterium]
MRRKTSRPLSEVVAEAEVAVAAVKDPELRRVAFERVLSSLLERSIPDAAEITHRRTASVQATPTSKRGGASRAGPKARVEELVEDGFFAKPKTIAQVKAELANRGHHIPLTSLSGPLQTLTQARTLRRSRLSAPGETNGGKASYAYSNW